ncbi:MAG: hypothetical protein KF871_10590 [Hydrogenophaga sp.]|uniref:hypothetical protein n=1 Tax=Hydrogenophaga sp. TaxID=1904254 RepID=UPI001E014A70|nr:hypothetical protein [Hydrogenophaga sp.]MBX3610329.1 hypothetical protein [Hydrogenophaga sp.]
MPNDVSLTLLTQARFALEAKDVDAAVAGFLRAAGLLSAQGLLADAQEARLAASAALVGHDTQRAEALWLGLCRLVPASGAAAAQRGLLGARIALDLGHLSDALQRLEHASEGALDVRDPMAYLACASQAAAVHVQLGERVLAYGRLATAWVTLSDLIGAEAAARWVRPLMVELRAGLGEAEFNRVKQRYEAGRRGDAGNAG